MTDGRVVRRERNQDTVLDAVVELFDAGQLEPAVDEVSDVSGVSTRSIYRYFHHRDGLIEAALWHLVDRVHAELVVDFGDGGLDQRLRNFVEHRLAVFARIAPLVRASKRLARPLAVGIATDEVPEQVGPAADDSTVTTGPQRSLFAMAPSEAFARDFERLDADVASFAAISADVMFHFNALDALAQELASDSALMTVVLERHLRQQITPG